MRFIHTKPERMPVVYRLLVAVVLTSVVGCGIDESINQDPNGITEPQLQSVEGVYGLLVGLQSTSGDFYSGDRSRVNSIWTWQMAGTGIGRVQPVQWTVYNMTEDGPTNDNWLNAYRGVKQANDILKFAPNVNFGQGNEQIRNTVLGMALAYKALLLGETAAMYGSIPVDIQELDPSPFVSQQTAYEEVQKLLDEALTHFADAGPVDQDLNFGGDGARWTAVVHSLKARYYLHVRKYAEALAEANQGIADPGGTLYAVYSENPIEYSPWGHWSLSEGEPGAQPIVVEKSFMDSLKSEPDDNRIAEYFNPNDDGNFIGYAAHGEADATEDEQDPTKAASLKKYGSYGDPFPFISYEETVLIVAEAEARVGSLPNALTAVNTIRTNAGLGDFESTDQATVIAQVLKQKHLELFLEGQDYHDMRRTGTLPDTKVPKRWIYPESEKNANPNTPSDDDALVSVLVGP